MNRYARKAETANIGIPIPSPTPKPIFADSDSPAVDPTVTVIVLEGLLSSELLSGNTVIVVAATWIVAVSNVVVNVLNGIALVSVTVSVAPSPSPSVGIAPTSAPPATY